VPKIEFDNLPREIARHLRKRTHQRQISLADIELLRQWANTAPEAPAGDWYKDFGSFKLCGTGTYPKTVLAEDMQPFGEEIQ
jgi:hypothetical protein